MLTRGLLCYAMSANVASSVTLLPAAFGILVLQKAGGVVKASVTPRLLPAEITLVTANARSGLISYFLVLHNYFTYSVKLHNLFYVLRKTP